MELTMIYVVCINNKLEDHIFFTKSDAEDYVIAELNATFDPFYPKLTKSIKIVELKSLPTDEMARIRTVAAEPRVEATKAHEIDEQIAKLETETKEKIAELRKQKPESKKHETNRKTPGVNSFPLGINKKKITKSRRIIGLFAAVFLQRRAKKFWTLLKNMIWSCCL